MDTVLHIKMITTFIEQRDNRESPTTTVQAIYADVNKTIQGMNIIKISTSPAH